MRIPRKYSEPLARWYALADYHAAQGTDPGPCPFLATTAGRAVDQWLDDDGATLLVLQGEVGSGKSVGAAWGCLEVYRRKSASVRGGGGAWWLPSPLFCNLQFARRSELAAELAAKAYLVVLDDLGREALDKGGRSQSAIDELVDSCYADGRRIIITTNVPAKSFRPRYGDRVVSRLRESGLDANGLARWWVHCPELDMRGSRSLEIDDVPATQDAPAKVVEFDIAKFAARIKAAKRWPTSVAERTQSRVNESPREQAAREKREHDELVRQHEAYVREHGNPTRRQDA